MAQPRLKQLDEDFTTAARQRQQLYAVYCAVATENEKRDLVGSSSTTRMLMGGMALGTAGSECGEAALGCWTVAEEERGRFTVNVDPRPFPSLYTLMVPPWRSTIDCTHHQHLRDI